MSRSTCSLSIVSFQYNTNETGGRPTSRTAIEDLISQELVVLKTEKDFNIETYIEDEAVVNTQTLESKLNSKLAG